MFYIAWLHVCDVLNVTKDRDRRQIIACQGFGLGKAIMIKRLPKQAC